MRAVIKACYKEFGNTMIKHLTMYNLINANFKNKKNKDTGMIQLNPHSLQGKIVLSFCCRKAQTP
jgi:hypothetical protein